MGSQSGSLMLSFRSGNTLLISSVIDLDSWLLSSAVFCLIFKHISSGKLTTSPLTLEVPQVLLPMLVVRSSQAMRDSSPLVKKRMFLVSSMTSKWSQRGHWLTVLSRIPALEAPGTTTRHCLMSPANKTVDAINDIVVATIPGPSQKLHSADMVDDKRDSHGFSVEYINSLNPNGIPRHCIELK